MNAQALVAEFCWERLAAVPSWEGLRRDVEDQFRGRTSVHVGWRFQLAVVLDAVRCLRPLPNEDVWLEAEEKLRQSTRDWGFRYFDSNILPEDLDTACAVTRAVGALDSDVRDAYHSLVARFRSVWPLLPTWLESNELSDRTLLDGLPHHADVLLRLLQTESAIEGTIDPSCVSDVVRRIGLRPHWYLQEAQPIFVLSQLIPSPSDLPDPIRSHVLGAWNDLRARRGLFHAGTASPAVSRLVAGARSDALSVAYLAAAAAWLGDDPEPYWRQVAHAALEGTPEAGVYWSVGFKSFRSAPLWTAMLGEVSGVRISAIVGASQ